jgi:hypothetical protein
MVNPMQTKCTCGAHANVGMKESNACLNFYCSKLKAYIVVLNFFLVICTIGTF